MLQTQELPNLSVDQREQLLRAAKEVTSRAYAPYSHFRVGAAVLTENGQIFTGCNVENASYGLTICAERAAIFSAVATEGGKNIKIQAIAVFHEQDKPCTPCGACRQVIHEFGPDSIVLFQGPSGLEELPASKLLPLSFRLE